MSSHKVFHHHQDESAFMTALNIGNETDRFEENIQQLKQQQNRYPLNMQPRNVGNFNMQNDNKPFDVNRGNFAYKNQKLQQNAKDYYPQNNLNYSGNLDGNFPYPPPNMTNNAHLQQPRLNANDHHHYQQQQHQKILVVVML